MDQEREIENTTFTFPVTFSSEFRAKLDQIASEPICYIDRMYYTYKKYINNIPRIPILNLPKHLRNKKVALEEVQDKWNDLENSMNVEILISDRNAVSMVDTRPLLMNYFKLEFGVQDQICKSKDLFILATDKIMKKDEDEESYDEDYKRDI